MKFWGGNRKLILLFFIVLLVFIPIFCFFFGWIFIFVHIVSYSPRLDKEDLKWYESISNTREFKMKNVRGDSIDWEIINVNLGNSIFAFDEYSHAGSDFFSRQNGFGGISFKISHISEPYYDKAQQDYYMEQGYTNGYNPYNFIRGRFSIVKEKSNYVPFIFYDSNNQVTTDSIVPLTYEIVNGIEPISEFPLPRPDLVPEKQSFSESDFYKGIPMKAVEFSYGGRTLPDCIVLEEGVNLISFPKADPPYPTFDKLVISKQYGFLYVRLNSGTEYFRDDIR